MTPGLFSACSWCHQHISLTWVTYWAYPHHSQKPSCHAPIHHHTTPHSPCHAWSQNYQWGNALQRARMTKIVEIPKIPHAQSCLQWYQRKRCNDELQHKTQWAWAQWCEDNIWKRKLERHCCTGMPSLYFTPNLIWTPSIVTTANSHLARLLNIANMYWHLRSSLKIFTSMEVHPTSLTSWRHFHLHPEDLHRDWKSWHWLLRGNMNTINYSFALQHTWNCTSPVSPQACLSNFHWYVNMIYFICTLHAELLCRFVSLGELQFCIGG